MVRGSGRVSLALLLVFFTRTGQAFWDPPYIVPDSPSVNDIVSLNIRMGVCDALLSHPGYPEITRVGNAIRYVQWGDHSLLSELCIYPTGTGTFGLGTFAPGTYSVSFDMRYRTPLGIADLHLGDAGFSVDGVAPSPASVPTLDGRGMLGLVALLIFLARARVCSLPRIRPVTATTDSGTVRSPSDSARMSIRGPLVRRR